MKDLQVKDLVNYLTTDQPIRFNRNDMGEMFIAKIRDFETYKDTYVTRIYCSNNELILEIQQEI